MTSQSQGRKTSVTNHTSRTNLCLVISLDYATVASAIYRREETCAEVSLLYSE